MGRRVSKTENVIEDPQTGEPTIREEIFAPEQAKHTSGSENYLDESQSFKSRKSSTQNPY